MVRKSEKASLGHEKCILVYSVVFMRVGITLVSRMWSSESAEKTCFSSVMKNPVYTILRLRAVPENGSISKSHLLAPCQINPEIYLMIMIGPVVEPTLISYPTSFFSSSLPLKAGPRSELLTIQSNAPRDTRALPGLSLVDISFELWRRVYSTGQSAKNETSTFPLLTYAIRIYAIRIYAIPLSIYLSMTSVL